MILKYKDTMFALILLVFLTSLSGCGKSDVELEDSYYEGYWDAIDCVKRKGGSATSAAENCDT